MLRVVEDEKGVRYRMVGWPVVCCQQDESSSISAYLTEAQ